MIPPSTKLSIFLSLLAATAVLAVDSPAQASDVERIDYPYEREQPGGARHDTFAGAREIPDHLAITWGEEPIIELTPTAGEIVLNGLWKFQPGVSPQKPPEKTAWSWIQVPGSWMAKWNFPHLAVRGEGEVWKDFGDGSKVGLGWYERPVWIPMDWEGRRIRIEFDRVSTDAEVFLNGKKCGVINWPRGEVDVTEAVRFGEENLLRVLVLAIGDEDEVVAFMGTEAGHNEAPKKACLGFRGIISDVVLKSQAVGPVLSAIGIATSVREDRLTVSFRAEEDARPEDWSYEVRVTELDGAGVKKWKVEKPPVEDEYGRWRLEFAWTDPELWDVDNPHLYRLYLSVSDGRETAVYTERFGFREFWVDGRDFYLNGSIFRLRPMSLGFTDNYLPGIPELIEAEIDGYQATGYNIKQIWPRDFRQRGTHDFSKLYARIADEKGMALMAPTASFARLVDQWQEEGVQEEWHREMVDDIEHLQNHPSILIWGTSANRFGHGDDQNPMRIGQKTRGPEDDAAWRKAAGVANDAVGQMNAFDRSRPVLVHQGSATGNIYATNTYLNLLPLQEREEWLSEWALTGDMPFIAVEFGNPQDATFMRGRFGGHRAGISEFLVTEHAADYLGPEAFALEADGYRDEVKRRNDAPPTEPNWHGARTVNDEAAAQEVISLFVENTWQSWRTWGLSGGMISWDQAGGIENDWSGGFHSNYEQVPKPPFEPGERGVHYFKDHLPAAAARFNQPDANHFRPSFLALRANGQPLLAYIGGGTEAWVGKEHHFRPGERFEKQIVLINDSRSPQAYEAGWVIELDGEIIARGEEEGELAIGEIGFAPFAAGLPAVEKETAGTARIEVVLGGESFEDEFAFSVYPDLPAPSVTDPIRVFDPSGKTIEYLSSLGFAVEPFSGDWTGLRSSDVLVIGEKALVGEEGLPEEVFPFVREGGSVLLLAQPRDWFETHTDFRVSQHVSRRYWPVEGSKNHPVVAGLDGEDLRDWRGAGSVQPERESVELVKDDYRAAPLHGWHWGNRGSVASVAIEKPHHAGWMPLLEGDFGLDFSPLLELDLGKGRFILSGLDLVDRGESDPVGDQLMTRLLEYLGEPAPSSPERTVYYTGSAAGKDFLRKAGLDLVTAQGRPPEEGQLWVVDGNASPDFKTLEAYAGSGGNVLAIDANDRSLPAGVETREGNYGKNPSVPDWQVARGISVSDLHIRFDQKARLLTGEAKGFSIGADGMLGYFSAGEGSIVYLQLHPFRLQEEYLRLSRWGYTRLLTQLLANLGAENRNDIGALKYQENPYAPISLARPWRVHAERILEGAEDIGSPVQDAGNEGVGQGWHLPGFDDGDWIEAEMPAEIETVSPDFEGKDGAYWLRTAVDIPREWAGRELQLELRRLDDFDITYFNGKRIGATNRMTENAWNVPRVYRVPSWAFQPGRNVIAIRVFDQFGGGGMTEKDPTTLKISLVDEPEEEGPYVPGYRKDRANGDDPFRYYRW